MNKIRYPKIENNDLSKENWLNDDNFYEFLSLLPKNDYCLMGKTFDGTNFIILNLSTYNIYIPKLLKELIKNCKDNYIIIPIRIVSFVDCNFYITKFNSKTVGHTNVIIYDKKNNSFDLFEPHGEKYFGYNPLNIDINGIMHYYMCKLFNKTKMHMNIVQKNFGLQIRQNKHSPESGHCTNWTLLFIHLKILNHNIDINYIINELNKKDPEYLDKYIRRYSSLLKSSKNYTTFIDLTKFEKIKINVNKNNITSHINNLFNIYYKTKSIKCKNSILFELKSFIFYDKFLFNSICLKYNHSIPFNRVF